MGFNTSHRKVVSAMCSGGKRKHMIVAIALLETTDPNILLVENESHPKHQIIICN